MNILELMKKKEGYNVSYSVIPTELQQNAKLLCWEFNQTRPDAVEERHLILEKLLGTCHTYTSINPSFRCDYGFNIHTYGPVFINYNCVILDTSTVHIGANVFIGPGVCIACSGHPIDAEQRRNGDLTSKPITIENDVWIGANSTIAGGVTIGAGTVIGAGSIVTKDIPAGVIAAGNPCRVIRPVSEQDKVALNSLN